MKNTFVDNDLGEVTVTVRRGTSRASIRRRNGRWWLILPPEADAQAVFSWIEEIKLRLLKKLPGKGLFSFDRAIIMGEGSRSPHRVTFVRSARAAASEVFASVGSSETIVHVGSGVDIEDSDVQGRISRMLAAVAYKVALYILLPRAREIAEAVGDAPAAWEISRGHHTLGRCSSRRVIALSCMCVFLTPELRDYIVCHELAHLREMNHSPRFHAICDTYLQGREKSLALALTRFPWPVDR